MFIPEQFVYAYEQKLVRLPLPYTYNQIEKISLKWTWIICLPPSTEINIHISSKGGEKVARKCPKCSTEQVFENTGGNIGTLIAD